MKKLNRREGLLKRMVKVIFRRDLVKNKIFGILLMILGCHSVYTLNGDVTVFLVFYPIAITIFFADVNVIG